MPAAAGAGLQRFAAALARSKTGTFRHRASSRRIGMSTIVARSKVISGRVTMLKEFRDFAMRGNVVDLAIGVIIGAAFGKIIDSLVTDVIMPIIGAVTGGIDFSNLYIPLSSKAAEAARTGASYAKVKEAGAVLGFGQFLTITINFAIIAFVLFLVIKGINAFRKAEPKHAPAPPAPTRTETLLEDIRNLIARDAAVPPLARET
jgi:large conductance mechanosensitive channel